jgi:hypothetical protein
MRLAFHRTAHEHPLHVVKGRQRANRWWHGAGEESLEFVDKVGEELRDHPRSRSRPLEAGATGAAMGRQRTEASGGGILTTSRAASDVAASIGGASSGARRGLSERERGEIE